MMVARVWPCPERTKGLLHTTAGANAVCTSQWQPFSHILPRHARHAKHLIPTTQPGRNRNGRARHLQKLCKKFAASLVRPTLHWRRGEGKFQCIAQFPDNAIPFCAGKNLHCECHTPIRLDDCDHSLFLTENAVSSTNN